MKQFLHIILIIIGLLLIGCGGNSNDDTNDTRVQNANLPNSNAQNTNPSNSNVENSTNSNSSTSNTSSSDIITFSIEDENEIRELLAGKTFYGVIKGVDNYIIPYVFNDDVTIMNEDTEDAVSISLEGNKIRYNDNYTPVENYTIIDSKHAKYIQTYAVYANGVARDDIRLYFNRSDATNYLNNN